MSYEKQNGVPKRRPPPNIGTQTPKVLGKSAALANPIRSPVANGSNLGRRDSDYERAGVGHGLSEDEIATPVKTFLSSNITPRSSARKARAETASPTWNGTPTGTTAVSRPVSSNDREASVGDALSASGRGLRIPNSGPRSRTSSIISDRLGSSVLSKPDPSQPINSTARVSSPENAPKFFHANDIKSSVSSRPSLEKPFRTGRTPEYVHSEEVSSPNGNTSSSGRSPSPDDQRTKVFHVKELNGSKCPPVRPANGTSSNRPQLQTIYSTNTTSSPPRATSPLKEEILPRKSSVSKPSPRRHTRLVSNGGSELRTPEAISASKVDLGRRSSLTSPGRPRYNAHTRSPSVPTTGPSPSRRSSVGHSDASPVEQARTTSVLGVQGALPHSVNPPSNSHELPKSQPHSQPPSPTRQAITGQSKIDQMNELAANARRERKVLDLEISNSSLLAINRTLEREMRKQSAELRQFRRLSRSGRISIAPSRSASGKLSAFSEGDSTIDSDDLVSPSEDEEDLADGLSVVSSSSPKSRPSSPTHRAARTRFQDPQGIELDLAAHRALLLDSQKMNVSIKRCLAQSEFLISSGRRALEHHAQTPKQENPGARVLTPDEIEGDFLGQGQSLLSPILDQAGINPWERSLGSIGSLDGGLETPDYSKWGPPTEVQTPFGDIADLPHRLGIDTDGFELPNKTSEGLTNGSKGAPSDIGPEDRRASDVASIDGLDDENDSPSNKETTSNDPHTEEKDRGNSPPIIQTASLTSRMASPERKDRTKSPDPQPGQPGYRGSMQGLGHYLQAFSIFGASQQE